MSLANVGDVVEILDDLNLPNTHIQWYPNECPPPPYAVIVPHASRNQYADDGVRFECRSYHIELYTRERDIALEQSIAAALREAGIAYSTDVLVHEENKFILTYFQMTLTE